MKLFPWDSVNPGCIFIGFHLSSAHPLWKLCHKHSAGGGLILSRSAYWTPLVVCFTKMLHRRCVTFKLICSLCKSFWKSHSLWGRFAVYLPQGCMGFLWIGPLLISCNKAPNTKQSKRPLLLDWPTSLPGVLPMVNLASKLVLVEFVYFFFFSFWFTEDISWTLYTTGHKIMWNKKVLIGEEGCQIWHCQDSPLKWYLYGRYLPVYFFPLNTLYCFDL